MTNFMQYNNKNACHKYRQCQNIQEAAEIKNSNTDADRWNDNNVLKDAVIEYIKGNFKLAALPQAIEDSIAGTYDIEEQERLKIKNITDLAIRGCRCDSYRINQATFPERTVVTFGDEDVEVWCNVAFVDKARKYVDCVIYQTTSPKFTKSGKNRIENYIPIYWLELMARQIAEETFNPGEKVITEAHFVYLKKTSEAKNIAIRYDSLDSKNILGIKNEQYIVGDDKETDIDKKLKELLDEFAIGKDCTPEDCKNCPNNIVCNFSLPPQAAEKHEVKIRKKIIPSEAQQTIIDWAKDIAAQ